MEKCYFEVGKTYVDEYRREFKVTEVRPHYPHRSTFDGTIYELPEECENYFDIFTDRKHVPYVDEDFAEKYESFAQDSFMYKKLACINDDPKKKDLICVVPGAHMICDSLEYDPETRDLMEYAMIGTGFLHYYHDERLTKEERAKVHEWAEKIYKEING